MALVYFDFVFSLLLSSSLSLDVRASLVLSSLWDRSRVGRLKVVRLSILDCSLDCVALAD